MKKFYKIRRSSKNPTPRAKARCRTAFNRFIRERDKKLWGRCISCKGPIENAGHFYSSGGNPNPSMDFNEMNVHGQCVSCNKHKSGNLLEYRKGIIKRYGEKYLEKLDIQRALSNRAPRWTPFEYLAMEEFYTKKTEELERTQFTSHEWAK